MGDGLNRILAALPPGEREALEGRLRPVRHAVRDVVYGQGERIATVVFPLSGVFSLVVEADGADPVEIATVGNEGLVGLPVFLQATLTGAHMAFSQVEGDALALDAADFLDLVNGASGLRSTLQRYSVALMTQIARGAACNRVHAPEQRAARWLLQTHDRVHRDEFALRATFLAQMLGEDPLPVTDRLAAAGLITYDGERLTVTDRAGLEAASCDCYAIVREEYERLLSPP